MKRILHIDHLRFLLPDDFTGSLADALRLTADYLDLPKEPIEQPKPSQENGIRLTLEEVWEEFMKTLEDNRKLFCIAALPEWDDDKQEWIEHQLKTGGGL
jgi:hypothetical protein